MKNQSIRNAILLATLLGVSLQAQYTISTIAGGGPPDGTQALGTAIGQPAGIAIDASGNLYMICCLNRVYKVAPNGAIAALAGNGTVGFSGDGGAATNAALNLGLSSGIAADSAGNLYIADSANNRIRKVSNGNISTVAGTGAAGYSGDGGAATSAALNAPNAVAVDSAGNLYIADSKNNRIRKVAGGTITTIAGTGAAGYSGDGGPATSAALNTPDGIAVDGAGIIYIADTGNNLVRKVAGGTITSVAGNHTAGFSGDGGAATSAALNGPLAVAVDSAGTHLFILDFSNRRVRRVTGGVINTVAGVGIGGPFSDGIPATSATLNLPESIAVDPAGDLYISDSVNGYIRKVTSGIINSVAGNGTAFYYGDTGSATSSILGIDYAVALDNAGKLYIADSGNGRIRVVANGIITTGAGTGAVGPRGDGGPATSAMLNFPQGVVVDSAGHWYIADTNDHLVRKVSGGVITTIAGNGTQGFSGDNGSATAAELNSPGGVAVDNSGNVYIADSANNRIREVNVSNGTITTVAGTGAAGYSGDGGAATSAALNAPNAVTVDSAGNLYIADSQNNRIRKVAGGTITTIAGTGAPGFSGDGGAATSATLHNPQGIAVDSAGNLFIADTQNNRIRTVVGGTISTIAGGGTGSLGDGGPATSANLLSPAGVAVNNSGQVYVADTYNHRVRLLTPTASAGTVSSISPSSVVAGSAAFALTVNGTDFVTGSFVQWNGSNLTTTFVSATQLSAAVPANLVATAGTASITVSHSGSAPSNSLTFSITSPGSSLAVSPGILEFGSTSGGATHTGPQTVVVQAPAGVSWVASANQSFISLSSESGTGSGIFTVSIVAGALPASGSVTGQVSVTASGVVNSPQVVTVTATIVSGSQIIGSFDTPTNNSTGVAGSIAVTGWALDSIAITKVDIWRERIGSEQTQANGLVYIGDAVFVPGARPDVEAAHPTLPQANQAGWGYLMLTNFLPNSNGTSGNGNGTYRIHAIAHNAAGQSLDLGTKTITCNNAQAVKPFGAIDTPGQGASISGAAYVNYGWALTHQPNMIPTDGHTIQVVVDGIVVGSPVYNNYRSDIATLFPGYTNSNGAVGYFNLNTTTMSNGLHTIAWVVTDNAGNADGIGSRYFSVLNSGQGAPQILQPIPAANPVKRTTRALRARPSKETYTVETTELGRIELPLGATDGYQVVNGERRDLPVGSSLKDGVFYWGIGPGFLGDYRLVFVQPDGGNVTVTVRVTPKE